MQNGDQGPEQEEEAPPEEFDEFVAEAKAGAVGANGARTTGGGNRADERWRTAWDADDPLYSDKRRNLNMQFWLRQSQTVTRMLFAYGFMDLSNVGIAIKNLRRLVQVHPPRIFIESLPWDQRYLEVLLPKAKRGKRKGVYTLEDLAKPKKKDGKELPIGVFGEDDYDITKPTPSRLPKELESEELELAFLPQDWWVFCGVKSEANARKPTGLLQMPYDEVETEVKKKLRARFAGRRGVITARNHRDQIDITLGIREARRQVSGLYVLDRRDVPLEVIGYCEHRKCWEAFNGHQRLKAAGDPAAESKRLIQFNTGERYAHMQLAKGLADLLPDPRRPDATPVFANTQTIKESIAAEEALLNMVSTVLRKPLLAIYQPEEGGWFQLRVLHVEVVVFASEDELNDLCKTVRHRKQWLGLERAKALARVGPGDVTKLPNEWYLASADPTVLRDITFPNLVDPASHLGYVWELAQEWARRTGNNPLDYKLPAAPEIGGWHLREIHALSESFNTLLEMAEVVREGGAITDKDLREKYFPKLVQYEPEVRPGVPSVIWIYWEEKSNKEKIPHTFEEWQTAGRPEKWVPHAAPYRDIALWYDWWWVMALDQYVYPELVEYVNRQFREAGLVNADGELTVRVTADEPSSNYFQHHDIAREIWRLQPAKPIEDRIRRSLREEEDTGSVDLRPTIRRNISGLPFIYGDGREKDLFPMVAELLEIADNLTDDYIAEITHAFDGTSRGITFAITGGKLDHGYRRGISIHKPVEQKSLRIGLMEIPLKAGYYDKMRGLVEAAQFDPFMLSDDKSMRGAIASLLQSRALTRVYAVPLADIVEKMRGPLVGTPLECKRKASKRVKDVEDSWFKEEQRLLGQDRLLRLENASMYSRRWVPLQGGLLVPVENLMRGMEKVR